MTDNAVQAGAPLYLASRSPRRRELLEQVGIAYELIDVQVDESVRPGEAAADYVLRVARDKALAAHAALPARSRPRALVLAADTSVVLDGDILGKPEDAEHALHLLRRLSATTHQVLTGVALSGAQCTTRLSRSEVRFRALDDDELRRYIASGEPMDKAGAYAIQGRAAVFIEHLNGSYSGVMGLPLFEVAQMLAEAPGTP